jgi:signal transduction histidine kinase
LRAGSIGIGIGGMRERAREFGGELRVTNADPGTLVEVTIPVTVPRQSHQAASLP